MRRLLLVLPLLLVACGSPSTGSGDGPGGDDSLAAGGGTTRADNDLVVEVDLGDGSPQQRWTLTCVGFVSGNHPEAERACEHLTSLDEPFAPLPADVVCTQVYGGPQTARVTGLWGGDPVDLQLSRTDGCRISQWDSLVPLVPPAS